MAGNFVVARYSFMKHKSLHESRPQLMPELNFLSELYARDAADSSLLAEYPSSNSEQTCFQNKTKFVIHDPFPPPKRELMKVLGPHHLMCGWGRELPVASEIGPPQQLLNHWAQLLGDTAVPVWQPAPSEQTRRYITLFPHEVLPAEQQVIDPVVNYQLHSKHVIERIDCPQAEVLDEITIPCVVKLTHGYAGLGNFLIHNGEDLAAMERQLQQQWPDAEVVVNSMIENIVDDHGVQFYLRPDGSSIWLGLTEQNFNQQQRWCGGVYRSELQFSEFESLMPFVQATAKHLNSRGYHGVVGIDVLRTADGNRYLVDVNPRLTGISPFLMASRIFDRDQGLKFGIYRASCRYEGDLARLIAATDAAWNDHGVRMMVLSAFETVAETGAPVTICHLSASAMTHESCEAQFDQLIG
jgi:hypothetical protein